MKEIEKILAARDYLKESVELIPELGVVLGSGWSNGLNQRNVFASFSFQEIPYFPCTTVEEHSGKLIFAMVESTPVVFMEGRVHYYEGFDMEEVVRPIRILKMLGVKKVLLTNSSGAVNQDFSVGDLVWIKDQISCFLPNPLRGANMKELGVRFPDMSHIYEEEIRKRITTLAGESQIHLKEGIYLQTAGPSFETPAEIRMYRKMGADLVGMSTACEAIAAKHAGLAVCGLSFVSNMASGITSNSLSMQEVMDQTNSLSGRLETILNLIVKCWGEK